VGSHQATEIGQVALSLGPVPAFQEDSATWRSKVMSQISVVLSTKNKRASLTVFKTVAEEPLARPPVRYPQYFQCVEE
jgi:hypothetical protein